MLCRLLGLFLSPAVPSGSLYPLQKKTVTVIDFEGFTKGIDNVHIDVRLSPQFQAKARRILGSLLEQAVGGGRWGKQAVGATRQDWEEFRSSYARMVEAALHRAKVSGGLALVQLVQVATLKFLLGLVQTELDQLRQGLRTAMSSGGSTTDTNRMELTERLGWLARNRAKLRYKLSQQLLAQLLKVEEGGIGELRHSLLGERWSLPEELLSNPLLQAESPGDDEILMKHYVLLGPQDDEAFSFRAVDKLLQNLFRGVGKPSQTEAALSAAEQTRTKLAEGVARLRKRDRKGGGASKDPRRTELEGQLRQVEAELERLRTEYLRESYAWADVPANVDVLFNAGLYQEALRGAVKEGDKKKAASLQRQIRFQRRLLSVAERRFRQTGLLAQVVASYELVPAYRDYAPVLGAQDLRRFLSGETRKKEILAKVKERQQATGKAVAAEALLNASARVDHLSCQQERGYLVRFLKDFVTFRRDLGNYHAILRKMDRIVLQDDPKSVRLSRTNHTLYEFLASNEEGAVAQTVLGHVILKADVRGSTTMVAELRKRGLNPASHFSLNFFEPLNELLETYGAGKVFIEGDAVILSILEHEETLEHQLSVARACGLAKRLLGMVQAQNALCRKEGLPELELGIGLVFSVEQPAFLYDGNTQIMISPAIGKADRLSSCSWMLRKQRSQQPNNFCTNVEIYEIPEGDPLRGEKGEIHLRYNLNGIELDEPGFGKLKTEISLQRLEVTLPGDREPTSVYTGRYPDLKGAIHRVVVREGKMRLLDKRHPKLGEPTANVFYEVVTDEWVLGRVHEALKGTDAGEAV
jgi:hypothetical protein